MSEKKQNYPVEARIYPGFRKIIVFVIILALIGVVVVYLGFVGWKYVGGNFVNESGSEEEEETILGRLQNLLDPNQFNTYDPIIDSNEGNENLGFKILSFEGTAPFFLTDEAISLGGSVEAASLSEDGTNIFLSCEMKEYDVDAELDPTEFFIPGDGEVVREDVYCSFEPGNFGEGEEVVLKATSDVLVSSRYSVWITPDVEDPIEHMGFRPDEIDSSGIVRSESDPGPASFGISSFKSQPFVEDDTVFLTFELKKEWIGRLTSLNSIELTVPVILIPSEEPTKCAFVLSTFSQTGGYIYELSSEVLEKINDNIEEDYKDEIVLRCDFEIGQLGDDDFVNEVITAEADYTFEVSKTANVEIRELGV